MEKNDILSYLFPLMEEENTVLVFPTENIARTFYTSYVLSSGKAVFGDRTLSFDVFSSLFMRKPEGRAAADSFSRMAFSSLLLSERELPAIHDRKSFPEAEESMVSYISSLLPELSSPEPAVPENRELKRDLGKVKERYRLWLEENGRYEESSLVPDASVFLSESGNRKQRFVIVASSSELPVADFIMRLGGRDALPSNVVLFSWDDVPLCGGYRFYKNEKQELRALFNTLDDLRKKGTAAEDIVLSTPDPERLRPYLDDFSAEYSLPLSFVRKPPIASSVPGRYLRYLSEIRKSDFSFKSMSDLFSDRALVFKDDVARSAGRIISAMVRNGIVKGGAGEDGLSHILAKDRETYEFYRNFHSSVLRLTRAVTSSKLMVALREVNLLLFGENAFRAPRDGNSGAADPVAFRDEMEYSFIVDRLELIPEMRVDNLFSLFVKELGRIRYAYLEKEKGIRVYTYGEDYLIPAPYHFVFGVNGKNCQKIKRSRISAEECGSDCTSALLEAYLRAGADMSGSAEAYSGAASKPAYFLFRPSLLRPPLYHEERADVEWQITEKEAMGPDGEAEPSSRLSFSSLDEYSKCPHRYYLDHVMKLRISDCALEPEEGDTGKEGTALHGIIQRFILRNAPSGIACGMEEEYRKEMEGLVASFFSHPDIFLFEYRNEYREVTGRTLRDESVFFSPFELGSMEKRYSESLISFPKALLSLLGDGGTFSVAPSLPPVEAELTVPSDMGDDYLLYGRFDTVLMHGDTYYILDYKRKSAYKKKSTHQLALYEDILRRKLGDVPVRSFYYDIFLARFIDAETEKYCDKYDGWLSGCMDGISEGRWMMSSKLAQEEPQCCYCPYRCVCRERFGGEK